MPDDRPEDLMVTFFEVAKRQKPHQTRNKNSVRAHLPNTGDTAMQNTNTTPAADPIINLQPTIVDLQKQIRDLAATVTQQTSALAAAQRGPSIDPMMLMLLNRNNGGNIDPMMLMALGGGNPLGNVMEHKLMAVKAKLAAKAYEDFPTSIQRAISAKELGIEGYTPEPGFFEEFESFAGKSAGIAAGALGVAAVAALGAAAYSHFFGGVTEG